MALLRDLLKKPTSKMVFWDNCLQQRFVQAKEAICQLAKQGLVYYNRTRPTIAITDWCKDGIKFIMVMQQYCLCQSTNAPLCCKGDCCLALCSS